MQKIELVYILYLMKVKNIFSTGINGKLKNNKNIKLMSINIKMLNMYL